MTKADIDRLGRAFWGLPYKKLKQKHLNVLKAIDWNEIAYGKKSLFDFIKLTKEKPI
jgi:hypothetical protein